MLQKKESVLNMVELQREVKSVSISSISPQKQSLSKQHLWHLCQTEYIVWNNKLIEVMVIQQSQ